MSCEVTWVNRGCFLTYSGDIGIEDTATINAKLVNDHRFSNLEFMVVDYLAAQVRRIKIADVKYSAAADRVANQHVRHLRLAMVASDPYAVKLCLNYINLSKKFGNTWEFGVYKKLADASRWVNYSPVDLGFLKSS